MKKQALAIGAACAATFAIFAASDRIDVYDAAGKFISIMVDDIQEITLGKSEGKDAGYTTLNITTTSGTKVKAIAELSDTRYTPVDLTKPHEIAKQDAPNAQIVLLDCRNNTDVIGTPQIDPTKPADWRGCEAEGIPHFQVKTDKGFASEYTITGQYTGKVYTDNPNFVYFSPKDMNLLGQDCLAFDMPFEPILIAASSVELDTYADAHFLGTYTGYLLNVGDKRITHKAAATLTAEFRANGTYVMKSTDDKAYDILDLFTWNETANTFAYVPYEGDLKNQMDLEIKTGVDGKFTNDGFMFATFHDLLDGRPDFNVKYFAAKGDMEFTVAAADEYGYNVLVQAVPADGSGARYFFYENRSTYPAEVTMEYSYGNNIGGDCTAFAFADGEKIFKYDYKGAGYEPEFTFRGAEYGAYNGAAETLTLDGFGKCTLGETAGTYTIDGGLASVTIGSESRLFVVDRDARTYSEMVSDTWDGAAEYTNDAAAGSYRGAEVNNLNSLSIQFDKDYAGNAAPGTAAVRFKVLRNDGFTGGLTELVASAGKYIYNAESNTIIITNLYMGTSATTSTRRNLVLKVAADKLSMWIDDSTEDRIYGTGRDGSYILTGSANALLAPVPPVALEEMYKGAPTLNAWGDDYALTSSIEFDAATSKANITIFSPDFDMNLLEGSFDYEVKGNNVTIKQVTSYEMVDYQVTATPVDVVFTVAEDGTMTSTQAIKIDAGGDLFDVTFDGAVYAPFIPEPVELEKKYEGAPTLNAWGDDYALTSSIEFDAETGRAAITIYSPDFDMNLLEGSFDYVVKGNKVTIKQVTSYEMADYMVTEVPVDIVFVVAEDGIMTSTQAIKIDAGGDLFDVNFSGATYAPAAVGLAASYTATYTPNYNGSPFFKDAEITIAFDSATGNATISAIVGGSMSLKNITGAFELSGTTVTIKDLDHFDMLYGFMPQWSKTDLVFTLGDNGELTCEGSIGLTDAQQSAAYVINFSDAPLTPAE